MASYYSVVQYVPDDVQGERINIGVVVFGGGRTLTHFVSNWDRVRGFAPVDVIAGLKEFGRQAKRMDQEAIIGAAERWSYGIQFTPPAGSLLGDDALLYDSASRFLTDPPKIAQRGYLVKSDVATLARKRVREALVQRLGGRGSILLKDDYRIAGHYQPHPFDLAVANGHAYYAAEAVSFQVPDFNRVERNSSAAAFTIQDVRRANPNLRLAVIVALPKDGNTAPFDGALAAFRDNGADVITDDRLNQWAIDVAAQVPA